MFIKILFLLSFFIFGACATENKHQEIVRIPEASGISFCKNSNSLVVANDEGSFYEIDTAGKILRHYKLGDYDLEGVVCEKEHFVFAIEGGALLKVNRKTLASQKFKVVNHGFKISKKHGIEGMTKMGDLYYLTIQAKKKKKAKILVVKLGQHYAKVVKTITHGLIDTAGMEYYQKRLYMVSDKKDKLYLYNLEKNRIVKTLNLPKFAQEGIAFDGEGAIYFADDNGAIRKYRLLKSFKLQKINN